MAQAKTLKAIQAEVMRLTERHEVNTATGLYVKVYQGRRVSLQNIKMVADARLRGDYSEVYKSKLYQDDSGVYCVLLEVIARFYNTLKEEAAI